MTLNDRALSIWFRRPHSARQSTMKKLSGSILAAIGSTGIGVGILAVWLGHFVIVEGGASPVSPPFSIMHTERAQYRVKNILLADAAARSAVPGGWITDRTMSTWGKQAAWKITIDKEGRQYEVWVARNTLKVLAVVNEFFNRSVT
ncbi:PepSY domain-containing protein [Sulfoacidibacillus thermotolerans]|uniref:PepSY domain-containing protein n=1 Tax=Sulfoacidibacillus thermotolerans TaxID=1765684 RepID=A0A2U3D159_SULT2|nr:PepSY domain-containing protein [Sulfoacidibacillus thermotolerans]PWI55039.1 hypothetical protein BM613_13485 [Sulfoacidibacillus thermotolerans]